MYTRNQTNKRKPKQETRFSLLLQSTTLLLFASRSHMRTHAILLPGFPCSAVRIFSTQQKTGTPQKSIPCLLSLSHTMASYIYDSRLSQGVEEGGKSPSTAYAGQKGFSPPCSPNPWTMGFVFFPPQTNYSLTYI